MKTFKNLFAAFSLVLFSMSAFAQDTYSDLLAVIDYADATIEETYGAQRTLRIFKRDFFIQGNQNADVNAFVASMQVFQSNIESNSDEIIYYARQAASVIQGLDVSGLESKASQLEAAEDYVQNALTTMRAEILAGNLSAAQAQVAVIKNLLVQQRGLATQIYAEANSLLRNQ